MLLSVTWVGEFLVLPTSPVSTFDRVHYSLFLAALSSIYSSLLLFLPSHCLIPLSHFFFLCLCYWPLLCRTSGDAIFGLHFFSIHNNSLSELVYFMISNFIKLPVCFVSGKDPVSVLHVATFSLYCYMTFSSYVHMQRSLFLSSSFYKTKNTIILESHLYDLI